MLRSGKVRKVDVLQCLFLFRYRYLEIWQLLSIIVPYCTYTNREGDSLFLSFGTIGISMYKKSFLPYYYSLLFYPKLILLLERSRQTEKILHPLFPELYFFVTEPTGPYPQAQLYWAGRTVGLMADWTSMIAEDTLSRRSAFIQYLGDTGFLSITRIAKTD